MMNRKGRVRSCNLAVSHYMKGTCRLIQLLASILLLAILSGCVSAKHDTSATLIDEVVGEVEAFGSTVAAIERRIIRSELPGGARVALLPKGTRGGAVVARITLRVGSEKAFIGGLGDARMTKSMLFRGTQRLSRQQLVDELNRLQAEIIVRGQPNEVIVFIVTVREHLPAVLALVAEALREPDFDPKEFEEARREALTLIEGNGLDPTTTAAIAFFHHTSQAPKGHPQYTATLEERRRWLASATVENARRFHEAFYGTGPGTTIAVVGDFDPVQVEGVLADTLGGWIAPQPFMHIPVSFKDVEATSMTLSVAETANAAMYAGLVMEMRDDHPDYPAMVLGNFILGDGFQFWADRIDHIGGLIYSSTFAPQNADRVEAAFREELLSALTKGFTKDRLASAKAAWLESRQLATRSDVALTGALSDNLYLDRTLEYDAALAARIEALTAEEIVEVLRRHINPAALTVVRAGPQR